MDTTPTRAGQALRDYIAEKGTNVTAFCEANGLSRQQVTRLMTGERGTNISARLALAIDRATDGRIPVTLWDDVVSAHDEKGAA